MNNTIRVTLLRILLLTACTGAHCTNAGIIDLTPGTQDRGGWNGGGPNVYAQSILADELSFDEFRFRPINNQGVDYDFEVYVTGTRSVTSGLGLAPDFTDLRFSASDTIGAGTGTQEFSYFPGLSVTPGETLFLVFLGTSSDGIPGTGQIRGHDVSGPDPYAPGEYLVSSVIYGTPVTNTATFNGLNYIHRVQDLAIYAKFSGGASVPEPSTYVLILMGFVGLALMRKKRRTI